MSLAPLGESARDAAGGLPVDLLGYGVDFVAGFYDSVAAEEHDPFEGSSA